MKKIYILFILIFSTASLVWADDTNPNIDKQTGAPIVSPHAAVKLSLWSSISTQGKRYNEYTNNFSFNLLSGTSWNEYGVSISGLVSTISNNARGFHVAGIMMQVDNKSEGVQAAALYNISRRHDGVMAAIGFSSSEHIRGVQMSGFNGAKLAEGAQLGFINNAADITGLQFGLGNHAQHISGVQIGAVNVRGRGGAQIGIINYAQYNEYPIGWLNIIKKGGVMQIGMEADNLSNTMAVYRSGGRYTYGILGMGYNFRSNNHLISLEGGWGVHFNCSKRFRINTELVMGWMLNRKTQTEPHLEQEDTRKIRTTSYRSMFYPSFRLLPEVRIGNIGIYAGPTLAYMQTKTEGNVHLFSKNRLWRSFKTNSYKQLNLGYMGGIHYYF